MNCQLTHYKNGVCSMFYDVEIVRHYSIRNIEADSEEEAIEFAKNDFDDFDMTYQTCRIVDTHFMRKYED